MVTQLLSMRGIGKSFPGVRALSDVQLDLSRGEVVALLGENGAGKSTLINILSGVFTSYEGQIKLEGRRVSLHHPVDAQRLGIATIHQELNLVTQMSVSDNIWLGRERQRGGWLRKSEAQEATALLLDRVGLSISPSRLISQLRVAEQQLVEVAKALSLNARILIMDEPTSALADTEVHQLFDVIKGLTKEGVGILYVSHRLEELEAIADRVNVLRDGTWVGSTPMVQTTRQELIHMMVGRDVTALPRRSYSSAPAKSKPRLSVRNLRLTPDPFTGRVALRGVDFDVHPGEILGLAGLMGSGRTETLESIFGSYPSEAVSGTITLDCEAYRPSNPGKAIRSGIALVAEDRKQQSLLLELSIKFNASLASLRQFLRAGFVNQRRENKTVTEEVDRLGVKTTSINRPVNTLSGGNQQKVVLAKCLLTHPSVILLDEPTRGIDVGAKSEIYELVNDLAKEGVAVVMASSELPELLRMCDRIIVLCDGIKTAEMDGDSADQEKILAAAMAQEISDLSASPTRMIKAHQEMDRVRITQR